MSFEIPDGIGSAYTSCSIAGFLVGTLSTVFTVCQVAEGIRDGYSLRFILSVLSYSSCNSNSKNNENLHLRDIDVLTSSSYLLMVN
ncbi:hypothetical protein X975_14735, partial [Stegodyphus mimosarum]